MAWVTHYPYVNKARMINTGKFGIFQIEGGNRAFSGS